MDVKNSLPARRTDQQSSICLFLSYWRKHCSVVAYALWHLNKCVYDLSHATLSWYHKVKHLMLQCETSISQFDPVFFLRKDGLLQGVVALHADDFRCTEECEEKVVTKLREICQEGKKESDNTLTDTEHKSIRSLIGKSLWASSQTQPYVALKA